MFLLKFNSPAYLPLNTLAISFSKKVLICVGRGGREAFLTDSIEYKPIRYRITLRKRVHVYWD